MELVDGFTPTTLPIALISGLVIGVLTYMIVHHFSPHTHIPRDVGLITGAIAFGAPIALALHSNRKSENAKKPEEELPLPNITDIWDAS